MKSSISRSAARLFTTRREPDKVLAALDDKTEAVSRELEAQHKRSLKMTPWWESAKYYRLTPSGKRHPDTGKIVWFYRYLPGDQWNLELDETKFVCPSDYGGKLWMATAYNPSSKILFVPLNKLPRQPSADAGDSCPQPGLDSLSVCAAVMGSGGRHPAREGVA